MRIINVLKKILTYSFYSVLIFSFLYLIYFIRTDDPYKKKLRRDIKFMIKTNTLAQHFFNDYNEEFLPNTEFIKVNFKKINLDFLELNPCFFGSCYSFFLEQYDENLIIVDKRGNIKVTKFNSLENDNQPEFSNIETNLNFDFILDTYIYKYDIYISAASSLDDKIFLEVFRGKFNSNQINFKNIIKLEGKNCIRKHSVHAGKVQIFNEDKNKILLSVNGAGLPDKPSLENLSSDSICGKILLVDTKNKSYEIYSSGHRNIIGLYADENVIIATEHGPNGGDELNKIKKDKKYGWPIVSHGEHYSRKKNDPKPNYKKNHKKNEFEEPIFSFVPSIGISEIIKLPNNFSELWQDNFLLASLNKKYLFRIKFNDDYNKVIYKEPIYVGDRIRDLIYNKASKKIFLALELEGNLGIITNKN